MKQLQLKDITVENIAKYCKGMSLRHGERYYYINGGFSDKVIYVSGTREEIYLQSSDMGYNLIILKECFISDQNYKVISLEDRRKFFSKLEEALYPKPIVYKTRLSLIE